MERSDDSTPGQIDTDRAMAMGANATQSDAGEATFDVPSTSHNTRLLEFVQQMLLKSQRGIKDLHLDSQKCAKECWYLM